MNRFVLRLLGGFELRTADTGSPIDLRSKKARALLTYLALAPASPVSRERLAALLWPESSEAQARASLRQALATLRRALGDAEGMWLQTSAQGVSLCGADIDVVQLQALVTAGDEGSETRAAELSVGPLLDGFDPGSEAFEDWMLHERMRVNELLTKALGQRLDAARQRGDLDAVSEAGRRLVAIAPHREDVHRSLMRAYMDAGQWNEGLKQYAECETRLRDELGVEPQAETVALRDELSHRRNIAERHAPNPSVRGVSDTTVRRRLPFVPSRDEGKPALVVLPFQNLMTDGDDYLSDGITEDIITELSRFAGLFVISRNSSFAYKGQTPAVAEIGRELRVQYILKGTIRRSGKRVRLAAQLLTAASGHHIWAQRYDRELVEVFELQDELSRAVVGVLPGRVEDYEAQKIARYAHEDMAAYELLLAAKIHHHRCTRQDCQHALALLDRVIELAPGYAAPFAWKACLYGQALAHGFMPGPEQLFRSARECVERALELDPNEVEGHRVQAEIAIHMGQLDVAERHNARALAFNPNDPRLVAQQGELLTWLGKAGEGAACVKRAMRLDPYGASSWSHLLGRALLQLGQYEEAIEAYETCAYPRSGHHVDMAACHVALGSNAEAARHVARALELTPSLSARSYGDKLRYGDEVARDRHRALVGATTLPRA